MILISGNSDDHSKSKMSSVNTLKLVHGRNKATTCDIFQYGATVISWKVRWHICLVRLGQSRLVQVSLGQVWLNMFVQPSFRGKFVGKVQFRLDYVRLDQVRLDQKLRVRLGQICQHFCKLGQVRFACLYNCHFVGRVCLPSVC